MQSASQSPWRHLPNAVSLLRIVLILPIAWLLLQRAWLPALGLIAVAGASDGLDGFLARHYGWRSRVGGLLDAVADKLLLVTCFVTMAWLRVSPAWLTWVVCGRDAMIAAGALLWRVMIGPVQPQPSMLSKMCTVAQIVYLLAALLVQAGWNFVSPMMLGWVVAVLCVASWLDYAVRWSGRARRARCTR